MLPPVKQKRLINLDKYFIATRHMRPQRDCDTRRGTEKGTKSWLQRGVRLPARGRLPAPTPAPPGRPTAPPADVSAPVRACFRPGGSGHPPGGFAFVSWSHGCRARHDPSALTPSIPFRALYFVLFLVGWFMVK